MAGASFKMDFSRANRVLGRAAAKIAERQELAEALGEQLVSSTIERFETGTGPDGEQWHPSARAEAENGKTLVDNGHLKGSINYEASPAAVAVGTTDETKGAIHQFGGTIKPKKAGALKFSVPWGGFVQAKQVKMPARPYIGINQADIDEAQAAIQLFIQQGLGVK
jgi:phage virion morphogenesis protein